MNEANTFFKKRQFLPGPTAVWSQKGREELTSSTYHRSLEFKRTLFSVREKLAPFFGTKNKPIIFNSSGTGAMESSVVNLTNPGDDVLIICAGKFGERWVELCESYRCNVHVLNVPWGEALDLEELEKIVGKIPQLKACFFQGTETSTGVCFPIDKICSLIKSKTAALTIVDAIASLCSEKNEMDAWKVDCMIGGSQKGFGVSTGLSFLALSDYALQNLSSREKFYFNYKREFFEQEKGFTAWSSATTLLEALDFSLNKIHDFGLDRFVAQHDFVARSLRFSLEAMGCKIFSKSQHSSSVTSFYPPEKVEASALLVKMNDQYNVELSGGQARLKGKILRLGHLGFLDPFDIISALTALEYALKDLGSSHSLGAGVSVFMKKYYKLVLG